MTLFTAVIMALTPYGPKLLVDNRGPYMKAEQCEARIVEMISDLPDYFKTMHKLCVEKKETAI